jgi:fluoride exporter
VRTGRLDVLFMRIVIAILIAGALGALSRYELDQAVSQRLDPAFPWGTFMINISGAFLLGFLFTLFTERAVVTPSLRTGVTTGFLGAYTTFSTWMLETAQLLESSRGLDRGLLLATLNVGGSVIAGLLAVVGGITLARAL